MHIKYKINFILFILIHIIIFETCLGQDISVDLSTVDSLITENNQDLLYDINGDICSLVIITTELKGIKFYTNLGIEKIVNTQDGYKMWIPSQSNTLKLIIPDCPLYELNLPVSKYKYSVYIFSLKIERTGNLVIKDTLQPSLSFSINPAKTKIFINGTFAGKSPLVIYSPVFSNFNYLLRRKGYGLFLSSDSMDRKIKNISLELKDLSREKRFFMIFNIKWDGMSRNYVNSHGMPGIFLGVFGKTGFYGAANYISVNSEINFGYDPSPYYTYDKGQKYSAAVGITQQLIKPLFIYGGPCYTKRTYQRTGYLDGKSQSISIDLGVIIRIAWYSLLQINYTPRINNVYGAIGLGAGFHFGKSKT